MATINVIARILHTTIIEENADDYIIDLDTTDILDGQWLRVYWKALALSVKITSSINITRLHPIETVADYFFTQIGDGAKYRYVESLDEWQEVDLHESSRLVQEKSADYTVTIDDELVKGDASSNNVTFTLPTAVGNKLLEIKIIRIDSSGNTLTIDVDGTETINGSLTKTLITQYDSVTLTSDGANWLAT